MITANILQRTFRISYGNKEGTCFTLDLDGRQYLVTARHVVQSIDSPSTVRIFHDGAWKDLPVQLVGHGAGDIDITVLAAQQQVSPTYTVHATLDGLIIGQEVFFLGFPYGFGSEVGKMNDDFPVPFVKKAIVSATDDSKGSRIFFLDGHNNPGFSGGPVVYCRASDGDMMVVGVVSGYISFPEPVYNANHEPVLNYYYNTGIIKTYSIAHATELIRGNPIGFDLHSG